VLNCKFKNLITINKSLIFFNKS